MIISKKQSGFALPIVILIVVTLIVAGGAGYYFYKTSQEQKEQAVDETADWKIYQNEKYGFSFSYPENFQLSENNFARGSLLASTYIEEPIPFSLILLQDKYIDSAQTPLISLDVIKTNKTIEQLLDHIRKVINEQAKVLEDPEAPYYGALPPEIKSVETVTIGDLKITKVVLDIGPGGPNPILLKYYIAHSGYVFVFFSNYGSPCSPGYCGETEKKVLPKILSTFKFIESEQIVDGALNCTISGAGLRSVLATEIHKNRQQGVDRIE